MGKTKIKTIDDSAPQEESKTSKPKPPKKGEDALVEKLKEELGIKPEKQQVSEPQKPGKAKPRSKKYLEASKDLDRSKTYPLPEALDMVKRLSYAKFDATLEAHINTLQTGLRGLVSLPYAVGKKLRILAFGKGADQSGANFVGSDETIDAISKGKVDFDLVITTPEWMHKLTKVAKVLGPKGLLPNPKAGTITDDLKKAVESFQAGKTEYKTEPKAPVIHMALGKLSQPNEELEANIKILLSTLGKTKIKKVTLSPTMGPGVKLDLTSI
ncbi:MAG: Ribosomal protein [Microgenomates group bacterium Gr01-1014_7]|nr:MAG: Ribosomal protein [Microgenomates group bacterium Gr01-1014_7]